MENLNIKGMFQNSKWSLKLQKIGLYKLLNMIKYKSEWYGKTFIQIDRFYPSSQRCNICGYQKNDLTLKIRAWKCPICGTHHHRDLNAAKKHLKRRTKNTKSNKCMKKIFFFTEPVSQRGIAWVRQDRTSNLSYCL